MTKLALENVARNSNNQEEGDDEREFLTKKLARILQQNPDLVQQFGQVWDFSNNSGNIANFGANASGNQTVVGNGKIENIGTQNLNPVFLGAIPDSKESAEQVLFKTYLEDLQKECDKVPMAALGNDNSATQRVSLAQVFIGLNTTTTKDNPEKDKEKNRYAPDKLPVSALEAAQAEKRIVFVGDAGSGKSSFVKNLIYEQCDSLLNSKVEQGFWGNLIPVYLELRRLKPKLNLDLEKLSGVDRDRKLCDAMREQICEDARGRNSGQQEFSQRVLDAIRKGEILLVLDGLDEVPPKIRELVRKAAQAAIQEWNAARIIITSRPNGYDEQKGFSGFAKYQIDELDDEMISLFARKWYQEQIHTDNLNPMLADERGKDLGKRATGNELVGLARNPMMLTCMAIIHSRDEAKLPNEKTRLFSRLVYVLSKKWQDYKSGSQDMPGLMKNNVIRAVL
jgi:hypothetical protein